MPNKLILVAVTVLLVQNIFAQTNLETPIPNEQPIEFKASDGSLDGTMIKRYNGNALRLRYAGNFLIFDALTDHGIQIRNSADQSKIMLSPSGHSYFMGGNIGVGTSNPTSLIHLNSTSQIGISSFIIDNTGEGNSKLYENNRPFTIRRNYSDDESFHIHPSDNSTVFTYKNDENFGKIHFRMVNMDTENSDGSNANDNYVMTIAGNIYGGYVAIGDASAPTGFKFSVDGKAIMEEVVVQISEQWPDYVFKPEYQLISLEEVKKHIDEKGHLPNIPSAKEVNENGISLGEMNRLLLEKVEELTLHIIQQEERIKKLEQGIK